MMNIEHYTPPNIPGISRSPDGVDELLKAWRDEADAFSDAVDGWYLRPSAARRQQVYNCYRRMRQAHEVAKAAVGVPLPDIEPLPWRDA